MGSRALAALLLVSLPVFGQGSVLYKSIDENGVVMFSDMPPPAGSRLIEQREVGRASDYSSSNGAPPADAPTPLNEGVLSSDAVLARANARLDEAERALAESRRAQGPINGAVRLAASRASVEDEQRIEENKRNVKVARARVIELMRERQVALARR